MNSASGFVVLDAGGEFVAWSPDHISARRALEGNRHAHHVERCSDGAEMSVKPRKRKAAELLYGVDDA